MARKSVRDCRTSSDFVGCVKRQGGYVEQGASHTKVYNDRGEHVAIPRHRGDLAKGMRCKLVKLLAGLGFSCAVVVAVRPDLLVEIGKAVCGGG